MKFPLQCFSKIITGTTGLLAAPDSGQDGVGGRDMGGGGRELRRRERKKLVVVCFVK
ncbi:hypothetical protein HanRHA438_Chr08g0359511 [Helianthus annuus]|nr:hypothetical protein HanIR_Chr08g0374731 [Helianthus annuus]KAJ0898675.1 hypothetical protein HanRHA438_Chr08g0359511 [Helianthus annuus]